MSPAVKSIVITAHAVAQYVARHRKHLDAEAALTELKVLADTAEHTKARTLSSKTPIWQSGDVPMVVRYDTQLRAHVVVTVLPKRSVVFPAMDRDSAIRKERAADLAERSRVGNARTILKKHAATKHAAGGPSENSVQKAAAVLRRHGLAIPQEPEEIPSIADARGAEDCVLP